MDGRDILTAGKQQRIASNANCTQTEAIHVTGCFRLELGGKDVSIDTHEEYSNNQRTS
jgi:hypothetical protein